MLCSEKGETFHFSHIGSFNFLISHPPLFPLSFPPPSQQHTQQNVSEIVMILLFKQHYLMKRHYEENFWPVLGL